MSGLEIEHKFLVRSTDWGVPRASLRIEQGYLFIGPDRNLRVRRTGDSYSLTLKVRATGATRYEIETPVDAVQGGLALEKLCVAPPVLKTRHLVEHDGDTWEVDVFEGANAGLILAEIELAAEGQAFAHPPWLGPEVTGDSRFMNESLASQPFGGWGIGYAALVAEVAGG